MAWLIVWLPLLGFVLNMLAGKFLPREQAKRIVAVIAPTVILAAFAVAAFVVYPQMNGAEEKRLYASLLPWDTTNGQAPWIMFAGFRVNFGLLIDPLSMLMTLIVTGVGGLIHIYATEYMKDDPESPRFFTYFNLFIFMMLLLVLGENFLLMFVGWEGVGTCSYLLISFWHTQTENAKAGNKAFIVNRVGDLGFALGMMGVWSLFGTLSYRTADGKGVMDLAAKGLDAIGGPLAGQTLWLGPALTVICILLFIGAMGKSAQIPLWVWLPDAMAGPTPVSALIHAATMVTAGVVMLTRCSFLFVQAPAAMEFVAWIGVLTAFMGATIGLVQNDIKRVLAFSTVSQLGYMFLGCGAGNFTAGMFHVTTHAFFKALLFLGSGAVIHSMLGEQDMRKMGGLKSKIPKTYLLMWIGTLAIAGFPLFSGIWSKDEILEAASEMPGIGIAFYTLGTITALMTAFYMGRMMMKTFYGKPQFVDGELPHQHHSNFDDHDAHGHDDHGHGEAHDDHGHGHEGGKVHESPMKMLGPLFVLALLSIGFGPLVSEMTTKSFAHFLEPSVAPKSLYVHAHEGAHLFSSPWIGFAISTVVGLFGLAIAYSAYSKKSETNMLVPEEKKRTNPLYQFLLNKWYWDALYNTVFIKIGGWFAEKILWRTVDAGIIDGTVNGAGYTIGGLSKLFRQFQTGYVRNYALAMLFGVVVLVSSMLWTWNHLTLK